MVEEEIGVAHADPGERVELEVAATDVVVEGGPFEAADVETDPDGSEHGL